MKLAVFVAVCALLAAAHCDATSKMKATGRLRAALTARDQTRARDYRSDCYSIKVGSNTKVCSGDHLRDAVLEVAHRTLKAAGKLSPQDFPDPLKKCSSAPAAVNNAAQPNQGGAEYYGPIHDANVFRKHAAAKCGALNAANINVKQPAATARYFSIGKYLYFRDCSGGGGNGYVYLWGTTDNSAVECRGHDYPSMYAAAKDLDTKSKKNSEEKGSSSVDGFKKIATEGKNPNPYMGMAAAAVLIAEAARDYHVAAFNYMFPDLTDDAELILGGRCPHNAGTCQNSNSPRNGLHPMAFGGAQASYCNGGWPQQNNAASGARTDEALAYYAEVAVKWFQKKGATKAPNCSAADNSANCISHVTNLIKGAMNVK